MSDQHQDQESMSFSERFVPLADNNTNLSFSKAGILLVSLALVIFGLVKLIGNVGYLTNDEQVEWRKEHHKPMKDSDENKHMISGENMKDQEEMKDENKSKEMNSKEEKKMEEENKMEEKQKESKPDEKMEKKEEKKHQ